MDIEQKTAIVVPCYNEAQRLDTIQFIQFTHENKNISFIFVDDGSLDNTRSIIKNMKNRSGQILAVFLTKNYGKSEAVRQGFLKAQLLGFNYIGFWDADLSTPLSSIKNLYKVMVERNVSIVSGARVRLLGRDIQRKSMRHYLGRLFATLASLTLNLPIYDTQCGAKLFKNNEMLTKVISIPFSVGWIFDVEIFARYKIITESEGEIIDNLIIEYPLEKWTHQRGSKVKAADFAKAAVELFKIYIYLKIPHYRTRYSKSFNS